MESPDSYDYDPRKPVPSIGGDLFVEPNGARDHRPAERLSLTYTTPVLEQDTEVTGLFAGAAALLLIVGAALSVLWFGRVG